VTHVESVAVRQYVLQCSAVGCGGQKNVKQLIAGVTRFEFSALRQYTLQCGAVSYGYIQIYINTYIYIYIYFCIYIPKCETTDRRCDLF